MEHFLMKREQHDYCSRLIFDNSLTKKNYYPSLASHEAPSQLKSIDNRLPVSEEIFFSPPNSLELTWQSHEGGNWLVEVQVEDWRGRLEELQGDTLGFWLYSESEIKLEALPKIALEVDKQQSPWLALASYLTALDAKKWTRIEIPLSDFLAFEGDSIKLQKVLFSQSLADEQSHTLYLDEVKLQSARNSSILPSPNLLEARSFARHIELHWEAIESPELEYYLVYRAIADEAFRAIGIQQPPFNRYVDYLGEENLAVSYYITAVNHRYEESPASKTFSGQTRAMSDDEVLDMVQEAHFRYYWDGAEPESGLALECIPGDKNMVALGAAGFGLMALIVGIERNFISREQGIERIQKVVSFLAKADRYHGVWSHFLDGRTGKTVPFFGKYDNGGDLVETAFMAQALLCLRQYFDRQTSEEEDIRTRITALWESIEWDWYRAEHNPDFLFWHWSPDWEWHIGHSLIGWNETMIVYLLAIASPTHAVPPSLYYSGWASQSEQAQQYRAGWGRTADGDHYSNGQSYYGLKLDVGVGVGGPLFFTHYSFLGFDPRGKRDKYTNYFQNNRQICLINYRYCLDNPQKFLGYSPSFWGLTASDDHTGYVAHDPFNDNGTMTPTGALASFPYVPEEAMAALKGFYYEHGDRLWNIYGFLDAYNPSVNFVSKIFMGLNQAPIVVMIENHRSNLIWRMFMANSDITTGLEKIGFQADNE
jgi:hypothetical protein